MSSEINLQKIMASQNKYKKYGPYVIIVDDVKDNYNLEKKKYIMAILQKEYLKKLKRTINSIPLFNDNLKNKKIRNKCFKILNYYKIDKTKSYIEFELRFLIEGNNEELEFNSPNYLYPSNDSDDSDDSDDLDDSSEPNTQQHREQVTTSEGTSSNNKNKEIPSATEIKNKLKMKNKKILDELNRL